MSKRELNISNKKLYEETKEDIILKSPFRIPPKGLQILKRLKGVNITDYAYYDIAKTENQKIDSLSTPSITYYEGHAGYSKEEGNMKMGEEEYFNYIQAIHSNIAHENKIDNFPGSDYNPTYLVGGETKGDDDPKLRKYAIKNNLHKLFKHCINPIFKKYGDNLALTSVYRNKTTNKLLGGVKNSQHTYGYAADIVLTDGTPSSTLFNWCVFNIPQYHQLIWEYPERGDYSDYHPSFSWIHISYIEGDNQKIKSISSGDPKIHTAYQDENTFYIDNFTHRIAVANQKLFEKQ